MRSLISRSTTLGTLGFTNDGGHLDGIGSNGHLGGTLGHQSWTRGTDLGTGL